MPWVKWLPWRFVIGYVARAHGFLDPVGLLSRLHRFAQPSEVGEPIELLRAGVVFHARGLVNSRVIQHNLDWVWPYWIQRQFDPKDEAFIPRAFSITHVNLSHRNWTAVGLPDCAQYPIVDPRGLLTPFYDSWSLDGWIITDDGCSLLPSRELTCQQHLLFDDNLTVRTITERQGLRLHSSSELIGTPTEPTCRLELQAHSDRNAWLVLTVRPYNPEGISFVHKIALNSQRTAWTIDDTQGVTFSTTADRHHLANYHDGDVYIHLFDKADQHSGDCDVGMMTAAAMFRLQPSQTRTIEATIALPSKQSRDSQQDRSGSTNARQSSTLSTTSAKAQWQRSLHRQCRLNIADPHLQFLYDAALRTVILHSPDETYPGPYTYKRFWFRDAAFIIHALLCCGCIERAERILDSFPSRQTGAGYFHSQEGEWDANGEVLWIMQRFCDLTGQLPKPQWRKAITHGAHWITRKRLSDDLNAAHAGLLPAGFSAEHLGPNDYYYWDDFWGITGLRAAAQLHAKLNNTQLSEQFRGAANQFEQAVANSLDKVTARLSVQALAASPYRRMDAGAIGSLVCGYPLQLCEANDQRLLGTVEFLLEQCFVDGGFFQDMIHSGINPYLTLHVAQVLLRAEDPRYWQLMQTVARLASPTGQWPEAIHPRTGGGCMGDGQHVWAAAEWLLMIRNCFVREEGEHLIIGAGIAPQWLEQRSNIHFGPAPTSFGTIDINLTHRQSTTDRLIELSWQGCWHAHAPLLDIRLPGFNHVVAKPEQSTVTLQEKK